MRRVLLALVTAAILSPALLGQGLARGQGSRSGRDGAFRLAEAYLISNLQESVGLTDDEFNKALPLVRRVQAARRQQVEERTERLRDLRQLLASGQATEANVSSALKGLQQAEVDGPVRVRRAADDLDAALTPLQQAKYRVFEADVETRIRRLLLRGARQDGRSRRVPRAQRSPQ